MSQLRNEHLVLSLQELRGIPIRCGNGKGKCLLVAATMLPLHTESGQSSAALSRLANSPKPLLTKLLLRWLVLACTVGALMWMMGPLMLDFFRFGESGSEVRLDVGLTPTFEDVEAPEVPKQHTPSSPPAKVADNQSGSNTWDERKGEVREAFRHAWQGYMKHAYPADELLPQSGQSSNK